ncbi:MAG: DNA double-strand break repair nuclease NurA [candidate division WOR-3 bacterium]
MPFQDNNGFELSSYKPLQRILDSEKVNKLEKRLKVRKPSEDEEQEELQLTKKDSLQPSAWQPSMVVAIDGSYQSVPVKNGFPSAEYGYVTVASVLILLDKIRELEKAEFINPVEFRKTEIAGTTESVYAGANIVIDEEESAKASMRKMLFEEFLNEAPFYEKDEANKETLLATYEYLLKLKIDKSGESKAPECPYDDCENRLSYGYKEYKCQCEKERKLYSTDALRLHELHNPSGSCGEMYGQIMFTLERLWLINILRAFERMNFLQSLKQTAFILDGSLAVYSTSSWLAKSIQDELYRLNEVQKKITGQDLIILGIEKSGTFVNHFEMLDTDEEGISGKFPKQNALLLTDEYIKKNIILSESPKPYGQDTYFGRKFLYKTSNGYRVVCNLATFNDYQRETKTAYPNQFPRLADVMSLLDQIVSNRFQNSVSPLLSAHAEAAIPLNLGKRIFQEIAREIKQRI